MSQQKILMLNLKKINTYDMYIKETSRKARPVDMKELASSEVELMRLKKDYSRVAFRAEAFERAGLEVIAAIVGIF